MKKIKITILFLALLQTFSAVAQSTKIKNLENQRAQIKKEIIEINNLLSSNKKQKNLTFRDLEILAAKINNKERLIKINNDQINLLNADIKSNEIKSEDLKLENENVRKDYASMIFNSYKSRLKESRIMFLLSSSTFLEAFKRSQYFEQFSKNRKEMALSIQTKVGTVKKIIDTLNVLRAENKKEKEYMVWVNKNITQDFIEKMRKGVRIMGKMTKRCYVKRINDNRFKIVLTQGMNRQIRRMCEVLGYRVTKLKRIRIMNIHLDINIGEYRDLSEEEVKQLFN